MKNITKWSELNEVERSFVRCFFLSSWTDFDKKGTKESLVRDYNNFCEWHLKGRRLVGQDVIYFGGAERDGTFCDSELVWDGVTKDFVNGYTQEQIDLFREANEENEFQNECFGVFLTCIYLYFNICFIICYFRQDRTVWKE